MARLSVSISIARRFFRGGGGTREREGAATLKPLHPPPSTSIPQCKRPARQRVRGGMGTHNGGLCALSSGYQTSSHNGSVGKERVAVQGWQVIKERLGEAGGRRGRGGATTMHGNQSGESPAPAASRRRFVSHVRIPMGVVAPLLETPHSSPPQRPFWETHEALSR